MSTSSRGHPLPGTLRTAALCCILALAPAVTAQAQTYQSLGEGLTVGHLVLHPSIGYEYTYDNNILFMSTDLPGSDPIASGTNVVRARIVADLPIGENRIRGFYAPFYRGYTNDRFRPEDQLNHVVYVEGTFHAGRAVTIGFSDGYTNGTVSLQEQFARNGVPYGLGHYETHTPRLEFGLSLGTRHGLTLIPSYSRSAFTGLVSGFGQVVDYGYTTRAIEGRYNYRLSEPTTVYAYSAFEDTIQTETGIPDVAITSRSIGLGLMRTANDRLVTQMSGGYQTMDFDGGAGRNYSGPVAEATVGWLVATETRIDFSILRRPYASIYPESNYYIATGGRVRWTHQIRRDTHMDAGAMLQDNEFVPLEGVGRRERLIGLEVGAGHQFLKSLRGYVGLNFEHRESNVLLMSGGVGADPFNYDLYRIIMRIEAGWL